ncbi:MAG: NAD(P)H-dependent oxidoreductase subunit E [Deltaproteobacteria bacterium]|jgi:NADH:ubiquinone oxidoreductase subunit E|nr:NAD(P)H-dependent oxidoreductase subunit E [Deltaproteobacteria bacterium]
MSDLDEREVVSILDGYRNDPQQIIAALLDIQDASGKSYVDRRWALAASRAMGVPAARVHEILTFYSMFSGVPRGRHVAEVCLSGPCLINGGRELLERLARALGVGEGETTPDGLFTLEGAGCCGRCAGAPVVKVGDEAYTVESDGDAGEFVMSFREGTPGRREAFRCSK